MLAQFMEPTTSAGGCNGQVKNLDKLILEATRELDETKDKMQ